MPESKPKTTRTWDEQFAAFCRVLGVPVPSLEEALESFPKHFVNSGENRAGRTIVTFVNPGQETSEEE